MIGIVIGDCLDALPAMPTGSVDAIVTDPPYGLGFMGKQWDDLPPGVAWATECLRVLKPGGHLLAFGGTRTYHRLACAVEDAGFEIRDQLAWLYGSGFPKSLNVGKAIDKAAGATREVVGTKLGLPGYSLTDGEPGGVAMEGNVDGSLRNGKAECAITAPATPEAERWDGWGTALKPAHEPIVLARKPLIGTVSANILAHGAGALNVDGCRLLVSDDDYARNHSGDRGHDGTRPIGARKATSLRAGGGSSSAGGRWPANVLLDPEAAAILDEQTGRLTSGDGTIKRTSGSAVNGNQGAAYGAESRPSGTPMIAYGDSGGASRFFYVAKASSRERNAGLEGGCKCESRPRATDGDTAAVGNDSHTTSSGSSPTGQSPTATRSTTSTATRSTTDSPTSCSSPPSTISESTARTTDGTTPASGSDDAASAASGSRPTPSTTTSAGRAGRSTDDADRATSAPLSSESAHCARCGGVIEGAWRNTHPLEPTVKPIALMRWLVRLVTPPGGLVIDPFAGSGTTGIACSLEGLNFIGIEREADYVEIARARIAHWGLPS